MYFNIFRYYALELCLSSLDKLFLPDGHASKYSGPAIPSDLTVLLELALGLEYIHSRQLAHRDIKPDNVLIALEAENTGRSQQVVMKWADFGLSKPVNERGTYSMSGFRGNLCWMAPELLNALDLEDQGVAASNDMENEENQAQRGNIKSDVFAAGCVFGYYLLRGTHPYGSRRVEIQNNITNNILKNLPSEYNNYVY